LFGRRETQQRERHAREVEGNRQQPLLQWRIQEFYRAWAKKKIAKRYFFPANNFTFPHIISHFLRIISHFLRIYLSCGSYNPSITSRGNLNLWQNPQKKLKILVMTRLATRKVGAEPGH